MSVEVTWFSDPGCPWAYSASPALHVLRWRYGDGLRWRLVTIGLSEDPKRYVERGYSPARMASGYRRFRRFGMPFATAPRERVTGTGRACRAIVATRLLDPEREHAVHRALQFGWFTTPLLLDEDSGLTRALQAVPGLDAEVIAAAIDDQRVEAAYQSDRAEARSAAGGATEFQGKAAATDGPVRFTAPSLVFQSDGTRLEAGGFQPLEAYDVVIANLDRSLERRPPAEAPLEALRRFPDGLVTQELAGIMCGHLLQPDRAAAEDALIELAAAGEVRRVGLGDDALWIAA